MTMQLFSEPVSEPVRALSRLFSEHFSEVAFPGVDAAGLAAHVDRADELAHELAELRARVAAVEAALRDTSESLDHLARRAHGYAAVYSADEPEVHAEVTAIKLANPARRGTKRTRKSPPRVSKAANANPAA